MSDSSNFKDTVTAFDRAMHAGENFDTVKKEFLYGGQISGVYYYISGFGNGELTERLMDYMIKNREAAAYIKSDRQRFMQMILPFAVVSTTNDMQKALYAVYSGNSILILQGVEEYILIDTRKYPSRGLEEPSKDKVLRGSKEGFVEALLTNSTLIRRRIRDPRLVFKHLSVGSRTATDVLICYIEDLADKEYVNSLIGRIESIQTQGLNLGQESLSELLLPKKWYNPFPKIRYTERPDAAAAMLMEGSVLVLCDNDPSAMILPTAIFDFLQDTDDFYFSPLIGGYMKIVRNSVFILSLILLPLWFTLQQMPHLLPKSFDFLLYNGESFMPLLLQLLLVEFAVDGLKLASLNTPDTLANSLSVISALILGDLAVSVGWLSEQILFYMAFVAIAGFTQPSYELGYAFKFMRMITLVLISFLSWVGLLLGVFLTIFLIATNNSISGKRGYLYPLIPFNKSAFFRLVFRARLKGQETSSKMRK